MLADFFTKPLQGNLFRKLKAVVMGQKHVDTLKEIPPTTPQERVEESADLENIECEVGGQNAGERRTDAPLLSGPGVLQAKRSYANVVRNRVAAKPHVRFRSESKRRKLLSPLTLRQ